MHEFSKGGARSNRGQMKDSAIKLLSVSSWTLLLSHSSLILLTCLRDSVTLLTCLLGCRTLFACLVNF